MRQEERNIKAAFYIPFGYLYCVRLRSIAKLLSWLLLYLLPTAFYAAVDYSGPWGLFALQYLLVLMATFTLYEAGYILNDTMAIRREEKPSMRLKEQEMAYFFAHQWAILGTRLFIAVACLCTLYFVHPISYIVHCTLSIILMCILFALYNRWRNRYNVFLYIWLVFSRYIPFMLLDEHGWMVYLLLFLSYPLLIGLERFSMPSYRWPIARTLIPNERSKARFRALYYIVLLMALVPLMYYMNQPFWWLSPIAVLAVYRILRWITNK